MGIPQIIIIVMYCLNLGITLSEHGKPRTGTNNFFVTLIATVINIIILYCGGFWS